MSAHQNGTPNRTEAEACPECCGPNANFTVELSVDTGPFEAALERCNEQLERCSERLERCRRKAVELPAATTQRAIKPSEAPTGWKPAYYEAFTNSWGLWNDPETVRKWQLRRDREHRAEAAVKLRDHFHDLQHAWQLREDLRRALLSNPVDLGAAARIAVAYVRALQTPYGALRSDSMRSLERFTSDGLQQVLHRLLAIVVQYLANHKAIHGDTSDALTSFDHDPIGSAQLKLALEQLDEVDRGTLVEILQQCVLATTAPRKERSDAKAAAGG